jgi:hypothetical protein
MTPRFVNKKCMYEAQGPAARWGKRQDGGYLRTEATRKILSLVPGIVKEGSPLSPLRGTPARVASEPTWSVGHIKCHARAVLGWA